MSKQVNILREQIDKILNNLGTSNVPGKLATVEVDPASIAYVTNQLEELITKEKAEILIWATGGIKEFTEDGSEAIMGKIIELTASLKGDKYMVLQRYNYPKSLSDSNDKEQLQIIKDLDDLFPDEELINTEWDTHWPRIIAYIQANYLSKSAVIEAIDKGRELFLTEKDGDGRYAVSVRNQLRKEVKKELGL